MRREEEVGEMASYKDFAYVYDEFMDDTPYDKWCNKIVELIREYGVSKPVSDHDLYPEEGSGAEKMLEKALEEESEGGSEEEPKEGSEEELEARLLESEKNLVVDLGCGTGTLTELLYHKGYDMIGVDSSLEMLDVAAQKKEQSGSEILYLQQDMRELELYSTVGTVVSVCDSLNYILEEEELLTVFRLVENYLYPGGIFIFDFNTVYKYEQVIGNTTIAENRENCSFIWENYYYPEETINEYDLTVFVREEEDRFRKFTETHIQRGYTQTQICDLVKKAGLELIMVRDSDTDGEVTNETERIYIVAREHRKGKNE